jgi:uncharacterized protein YggE
MNGFEAIGRTFALSTVMLLMFAFPGFAHEQSGPPAISVVGEAEVSASPDLARLRVSVRSEDKQARAAAERNARISDAVITAVQKLLADRGTVATESYSVTQTFRRSEGQQIPVGYRAMNTVTVETGDIDEIAGVIDAALEAGADAIGSLEFVLSDETAFRAKALRLASKRARKKANAIAEAMGLEIVRTLDVEEQGGQVRYASRFEQGGRAMMSAEAPPTPVAPGPVKVNARVVLRVEISD